MKGLIYIAITVASSVLTLDVSAQSRAYAKFDSNGETIGLFNLTEDDGSCRDRQVLIGTVGNVISTKKSGEVRYSFLLDTGYKRRVIGFAVDIDSIPAAVVGNLVAAKRQVSVDTCRGGGRWSAIEITRAGAAVLLRTTEADSSLSSEPDHK